MLKYFFASLARCPGNQQLEGGNLFSCNYVGIPTPTHALTYG